MEMFADLDPMLRAFWFMAIPASLIFIIQAIMTFIGADASDGLDADFDSDFEDTSDAFQLFSLRNLINFILGFSWAGISFWDTIANKTWLIVFALGVGIVFLFLFFFIIMQIKKLAEDNSFKIEQAVNKSGEVYLTIPAAKSGKGKIMVSVRGSMHELDAITEDSEAIESSSLIKVVGLEADNLLIVKRIK